MQPFWAEIYGQIVPFQRNFGNMASETPNSKKIFYWFILSYIIINLTIKHGGCAKYFLPNQIFSGTRIQGSTTIATSDMYTESWAIAMQTKYWPRL